MDDVANTNVEGQEAGVTGGRPTLMGTQHGSRLFCAHCGAHNAPGWASCFHCGASRPAVSNGHRYAAALGAAMVSAATFLMMWRLAHVPTTYIMVASPPPAVMIVPSPTVRRTQTVYTRTMDGGNVEITECNTEVVEDSVPAIVAPPVEMNSSVESPQILPIPESDVIATTGGNRR